MKNKLIDLNNHLFAQLERLSDEDLKEEQLAIELNRSKAIANIADRIVNNARLSLDAQKAINDGMIKRAPEMLGLKEPESMDNDTL